MNQPPTELESASVAQRFAAQAIDIGLLVLLMVLPPFLPLLSGVHQAAITIALLILALVYWLTGDGLLADAGFGKRLLGIYVADAQTRKPCSVGQSVFRTAILIIPVIQVTEIFILIFDGQQRWGDKIAGTCVLRRVPKAGPPSAPLRPADFSSIRESIKRSTSKH